MAISNFGIGGFDNADSSFQGLGNLVSTYNLGSGIPGCTDNTATNYNVNATWDDGSCVYGITGCTDPSAANYNASVTVDDGSCLYVGCMDSDYLEYDAIYNVSNPADCLTLTTYGCTVTTTALIGDGSLFPYPIYWNSDSGFTAPCDDTNGPGCFGSQTGTNCCCEPVIVGCTTSGDINYNPLANYQAQPGSSMECVTTILGCTNPIADNYDPTANQDDGSCTYTVVYGCTDATADNYDPVSTQDDGSCVYTVYGCTDPTVSNWMGTPAANETQVDDGSCCIDGCMTAGYLEYDASYTCDDGSYCLTANTPGCTDASVSNYDPTATVDDGSCCVDGCTTVGYVEYDPLATCDDGSCLTLHGCTDSTACNYDPNATVDDGSCTYPDPTPTCTDLSGVTYTIGDLHPTLSARLAMFSYDEPDSGMATGDCGRMYASIKTVEMAVSQSTTCTYIQSGMGPVFPTNWGDEALVPGSNPSGNLSSAQSQKAGWGYQNTEDMLATGGSTANAIGVQCPWGSGWSSYHNESPAFWAKSTEFQSEVGTADWHIPSVDELFAVWNNLGPGSNYNCPSTSFGGMNATSENCYSSPFYPGTGWGAFSTKCDLDSGLIIQYMTSNEADNDPINRYTTISWWDGTIKTRIKNNFQSQTRAIPVVYEGNFGCTDSTATNYDSTASWDDGSCTFALQLGDFYEGGYILEFNNGIDETDGGTVGFNYGNHIGQTGFNWSSIDNDCGTDLDDGANNTALIVAQDGANAEAAYAASTATINGYSDWYLPAYNEFPLIFPGGGTILYPGLFPAGPADSNYYFWTSSECDSTWPGDFTALSRKYLSGVVCSLKTEIGTPLRGLIIYRKFL